MNIYLLIFLKLIIIDKIKLHTNLNTQYFIIHVLVKKILKFCHNLKLKNEYN